MQLGRPTVYPDFEPVSCYFGHGLTGVMYKLGDVDSAVAALNDLLENSGRAAALGRAARQAWERGFNPKRFYETISSHMKDFFYEPH
jgi:glycosyltransferase involved in cell wall biosynthesis